MNKQSLTDILEYLIKELNYIKDDKAYTGYLYCIGDIIEYYKDDIGEQKNG